MYHNFRVSDFPPLLNGYKNRLRYRNYTKYFNKYWLPLINNTEYFERTVVNYALNDTKII